MSNTLFNEEQLLLIKTARHRLHDIPELSCEEKNTKAFILNFLAEQTTLELHDMGLWMYAVHREGAGKTTAFRADFDAIPAENGCAAHRCGHDGHTAALLALALLIEGKTFGQNIILLFQHGEEIGVGGADCCKLFELEHIERIYGCHNIPGEPMGLVLLKSGTFACASCGMQIDFIGKPTHAAYPENGINPTPAAAQLAIDLPIEAQRIEDTLGAMTIATIVGMYSGEKAFGVAASKGAVYATLRSEAQHGLDMLKEAAAKEAAELASKFGVEHRIALFDEFPATVNEASVVREAEDKLIKRKIGYKYPDVPFRWSEDFGHYAKHTEALFFGIGSGEATAPLHTEGYEYPDELIEKTAEVFLGLIRE